MKLLLHISALYLLVFLISVTGELMVTITNFCTYDVYPDTYAVGWAPGFAEYKFKTFRAASIQCDRRFDCRAITQTQLVKYADDGSVIKSIFFTLRGSTKVVTQIEDVKEVSYIKQTCQACDYQVYYGTKLSGCINNCQDFGTLQEAQLACKKIRSCGGVTLSHKHLGGSQTTDPIAQKFGFQLRVSSVPEVSSNKEDSWVKNICPTSFIEKQHHEYLEEDMMEEFEEDETEED